MQAHRGLTGAGRTLDAQRGVEFGPDQLVLVGLDGGHDVAHRTDPGPFDLFPQQVGPEPELLAGIEVFVFERGQHTVVETEPAAQLDPLPILRAGPVERLADRGAPVDHHRVTELVADVPAADVEDLAARMAVVGVAVGPAEERRGVAVGVQVL